MRKAIVAGNWKMNGSPESVDVLLEGLKGGVVEMPGVEFVVFPPYIFLEQTRHLLNGADIAWGAQNLCDQASGAFTGEISAEMLVAFGCTHVLVGHSERRHLYGEGDALVAAKFAMACEKGLTPILCVGETLEEREQGRTEEVVNRQLAAVFASADEAKRLEKAVIAYEPVWAIGTGKTATPEQAQEVHQAIRGRVAELDETIAQQVRILYGGSVKSSNAEAIFAMPDIDGGLIGGASLKAEEFLAIGHACKH